MVSPRSASSRIALSARLAAITLAAMLAAIAGTRPVAAQQDSEVEKLKAMVEALQKTVQELQGRIAVLEQEKSVAPVPAEPPPAAPTEPTRLAEQAQPAPTPTPLPEGSLVPDHENFADQQTAAPRPDNLPLDPTLRGFITIPGTRSMIKPGGSARVDTTDGSSGNGHPNWFAPSLIPVEGEPDAGGASELTLQTKGSRLSFEVRRPALPTGVPMRIYYENDFFGDSTSKSMSYRLRHLYGQGDNFLLGQTYTAFMDVDAWPDTLDYQGPNAMANKRQPQLRAIFVTSSRMHYFVSLEQPGAEIDTGLSGFPTGAEEANRFPDVVLGARHEAVWGHVQATGMARGIAFDAPSRGGQSELGWGLNLSGAVNLPGGDRLQYQAVYGEGMAKYVNDLAGQDLDAALDINGQLEPIPVFAPYIGYTHQWAERWRTTGTYGYVSADTPPSLGPLALKSTQYFSLNLIWQFSSPGRVGLELLRGTKETANGAEGEANRAAFVVKYDLIY
ncbi:MAG TPA: DcaP family trimeric outer membrane transporter [Thermoanaerobaculales bacterium]|nr:DcaP family trimeric outer membrane transporter [Thermoanaerobaculales bacterium]